MRNENMKYVSVIIFSMLVFVFCSASCTTDDPAEGRGIPVVPEIPERGDQEEDNRSSVDTMRMIVGSEMFTVVLAENSAAAAFKALLPVTVNMTEMNGNEKYCNLPGVLPVAASRPGKIHAGDLMLWGARCVVLFYETFSTSYSYTRLGVVEDAARLKAAVGSGDVTVIFELK